MTHADPGQSMPDRRHQMFGGPHIGRTLKYQEVADRLRRGVVAGDWAIGARLPTEQQLVDNTGFSLNTIRRAVDELVDDGLVERRQGAGTFVVMQRSPAPKGRFRIGVMVPSTTEIFPTVLQGVESALRTAGASFQLESSRYDLGREDACIERLLEADVDGLLLTPALADVDDPFSRVEHLISIPVPVVLLERSLPLDGPADRTEHVRSDYAGGAYDAVHHLQSLGHRRIMLMLRAHPELDGRVRTGYHQAVEDLALPTIPVQRAGLRSWEHTQAERMLDSFRNSDATAAFVLGDREAALLMRAASRRGMSVPDDLALVSYDNETAETADIPLSAIDPPKHRVGRMAAQILLQRIAEGESYPLHQLRLRPRLVIRESCGARGRARSG